MTYYVRWQCGLNTKGSLKLLSDVNTSDKLQSLINTDPGMDWYTSVYQYPEEIKNQWQVTKSVSGYKGPAHTQELIWDFDGSDLEEVKEDVRSLLRKLTKYVGSARELLKHINVYFSGGKGFHVTLNTVKQFTPEQAKHVCSEIALGLKTFDPKIYNRTRLIRVLNTRHNKTKLYKIKIDPTILPNDDAIEQIKALAKSPGTWEVATEPLENIDFISKILQTTPKKQPNVIVDVEEVDGIRGIEQIDFKKARNIPKCIYGLSQGIMKPGVGHRHHVMLHLSNFYRNQGHDKEVVHNILKGVARLNKNLYPEAEEFSKEEIWNTIIKMSFADSTPSNPGGWGVSADDEIFCSYCKALDSDYKCSIHDANRQNVPIRIQSVANEFNKFATNFEDNVVTSGIKFLDHNMKITTGITTLLVGASGSGKTSLVLNMLEHTNKEAYDSVFFSMDMHKNLLYLKLAQRFTKLTQQEIFQAYRTGDRKIIEKIDKVIEENYAHTFFEFKGSMTLDEMKESVNNIEQETQRKIKMVIVDYASRIKGPYSDNHANESWNAKYSKDVADETDAAWLILNQVSRASGDGSTPIRTKRAAKGASDWEESASNIITIWRPFMGVDGVWDEKNEVTYYDKYMRLYLAKNRMGPEIENVLAWNGEGGQVRDLTQEEAETYNAEEKIKESLVQKYKRPY